MINIDHTLLVPLNSADETFLLKENKGPFYVLLFQLLKTQRDQDGLIDVHVSWGPTAATMTEEERCAALLEMHCAPRQRISVEEFDRQTLAPHVAADVWLTLTREQRRHEIQTAARARVLALGGDPEIFTQFNRGVVALHTGDYEPIDSFED